MTRTARRTSLAFALAVVALGLATVLAQAETPDERAQFVQDNQATREKAEAEIAAFRDAGSKIPSKPDDPINDRPEPVPNEWAEGIRGPEEFSFPSSFGFEFENVWYHDAGDVFLTVLAGSVAESGKAVVQVIRVNPVTLRSELVPPLFPDMQGPAKIVDANGMDLTLESIETHERLSLDVETLAFGPIAPS